MCRLNLSEQKRTKNNNLREKSEQDCGYIDSGSAFNLYTIIYRAKSQRKTSPKNVKCRILHPLHFDKVCKHKQDIDFWIFNISFHNAEKFSTLHINVWKDENGVKKKALHIRKHRTTRLISDELFCIYFVPRQNEQRKLLILHIRTKNEEFIKIF